MSTTTNHDHHQIGDDSHDYTPPGADSESIAIGHELKDAHIRPLVLSAVGLLGLLAFAFIAVAILMSVSGLNLNQTGNILPDDATSQLQLPPSPRLEQSPKTDTGLIVTNAQIQLESYGWVDQQAGTAHIPIERAMELILQRGVSGE
ncbi:MAG: hypothetical protein HGA19_11600 [Oscillochloris sp.]|nr:hypothetical protein [Oscillochloris sp.]